MAVMHCHLPFTCAPIISLTFAINRVVIDRGDSLSIVKVFKSLENISLVCDMASRAVVYGQFLVSWLIEKSSVFSIDIRIIFTFFEVEGVGFWLFGDLPSWIHFWQSLRISFTRMPDSRLLTGLLGADVTLLLCARSDAQRCVVRLSMVLLYLGIRSQLFLNAK